MSQESLLQHYRFRNIEATLLHRHRSPHTPAKTIPLARLLKWMQGTAALHIDPQHSLRISKCTTTTAMFKVSKAIGRNKSTETRMASTVPMSEYTLQLYHGSTLTDSRPYVSPRAAWTGNSNVARGVTPPPNTMAIDPVELPVQYTPREHELHSSSPPKVQPEGHRRNQSSADDYYEDVDPRFAPDLPNSALPQTNTLPHALMPGQPNMGPSQQHHIDPSRSYESFQEGQDGLISPAASDLSNMTSISQRGVNPNWRPQDGSRPGHLSVPGRRPAPPQQQRDMVLNSNPDFELPGGHGGARGSPMPNVPHGQAF